jgi:hypothetical protein
MSIFMVAALLGLLLYEIVILIQPTDNGQAVSLGQRIKVELPQRVYLHVKVTAIVLAILAFLATVILVVAQNVHPTEGFAYRFADALTSPRMAAAIFGGLVGILLGNLLNRLLKNTDDYKFKASDYLEIGLIAALVILGIGGEEVLRSYANRISKISVGTTTEISFSDAAPKPSRASVEQPRGAFRNTQGDSGGSTGLQKLFDIGSRDRPNISRDKDFIAVLAFYQNEKLPSADETGTLPQAVLSPIASCLSGISKLYGDATFIEQQLTAMSEPLRALALLEIPTAGEARRDRMNDIRSKLSEVLKHTAAYAPGELKVSKGVDDRYSCADVAAADARGGAVDVASIEAFLISRDRLPYAAMAYASTMAALHRYEAAVITMDGWINAATSAGREKNIAEQWYLLRARLTLALFLEEWIRQRGTAASSWLRKYHIDNLKQIADRMRNFKAIAALSEMNGGYTWSIVGVLGVLHSGDDGPCAIPVAPATKSTSEDWDSAKTPDVLGTLYSTYLSTRKDYVDHSLKHPTAKVKAASIIQSDIRSLMSLSLRCIPANREITRAEHIERFVRSELNLLENVSSLKSTDEIADRIREAQQLLAFAFQLIEPEATATKNGKDRGPIQDRISTELVLEVQETLLATQDQLKSFSEREVNQ